MKALAFALLLLLVGCLPQAQVLVPQDPSVKFVLDGWTGAWTAYVFSTDPAVIRRLSVQAQDLTTDDPSCRAFPDLPGGLICAEGTEITATPGGYRINLTSAEQPVGNVCVTQGEVLELLLCSNLEQNPFAYLPQTPPP